MSKIEVIDETTPAHTIIDARDVPMGEVFFGEVSHDGPSIYLRAYVIVDLRNPRQTWEITLKGPTIKNYRPAHRAQLVIE